MKKVVFEGTLEQVANLIKLVRKQRGHNLPKIKTNYQTENLWSVEDVISNYECSDDEALEVLEAALTNEATMDQIWFAIHFHADELGLKRREEK